MERFQLKVDVEPKDIPNLDDAHKQDCADAINRAINDTFKYTLIFAAAVCAIYAVYTLFGFTYLLRMGSVLPPIPFALPAFAILIFIFEFISGTMKRWALFLEIIFHAAFIVFAATKLHTAIAAPFAFYGIIQHIKLITLIPHYDVISQLKGYPDFTPLPVGDVIKKKDEPEKAENTVTDEEKTENSEEKKESEQKTEISEEKKETEQKAENSPKKENDQPRRSGNSPKKNKKKKRGKSSK